MSKYIKAGVFCLLLMAIMVFLGCGKPEVKPLEKPSEPAQKLFLKSQKELAADSYEQAYADYQKAVATDSRVADISHLSSILYSWAISETESEDMPLLDAQRKVWLEPNQLSLRQGLMKVAVDSERGVIYAFGLGVASENRPHVDQRRQLARQAAMADAKAWVARIARWGRDGIKCPFDISLAVVGAETLKEYWIGDAVYVIKFRAPVDCLE